jgi:hypothetical protein
MNKWLIVCNTVSTVCNCTLSKQRTFKTGLWHVTPFRHAASILNTGITFQTGYCSRYCCTLEITRNFYFWGLIFWGVLLCHCMSGAFILKGKSSRKTQWTLIFLECLTLKVKALQSFRGWGILTRHHIPADLSPQEHCCENIWSDSYPFALQLLRYQTW